MHLLGFRHSLSHASRTSAMLLTLDIAVSLSKGWLQT